MVLLLACSSFFPAFPFSLLLLMAAAERGKPQGNLGFLAMALGALIGMELGLAAGPGAEDGVDRTTTAWGGVVRIGRPSA